MQFIRERVLNGEIMAGTWCNLGSSITVEIAARAGFDWVLIDLEHGAGDLAVLPMQLQAASTGTTAPIVRIAWNEAPRFKRVLDMGAAGVMVPYVSTAEEAQAAASYMRYPPRGVRGVAKLNRATDFGFGFEEYFQNANEGLLTVVQIETQDAVKNIDDIAAVDGADVLFVGPLDLSTNLGVQQQYDHPDFREAVTRVVSAAKNHGKAAGILLLDPSQVEVAAEDGFTFLAHGSDSGMVAKGMRTVLSMFNEHR